MRQIRVIYLYMVDVGHCRGDVASDLLQIALELESLSNSTEIKLCSRLLACLRYCGSPPTPRVQAVIAVADTNPQIYRSKSGYPTRRQLARSLFAAI
jgi:hypothetical protein